MRMQDFYDVLKSVEYITPKDYDPDKKTVCPWCGNSKGEGHMSYCRLADALKRFQPKGGIASV